MRLLAISLNFARFQHKEENTAGINVFLAYGEIQLIYRSKIQILGSNYYPVRPNLPFGLSVCLSSTLSLKVRCLLPVRVLTCNLVGCWNILLIESIGLEFGKYIPHGGDRTRITKLQSLFTNDAMMMTLWPFLKRLHPLELSWKIGRYVQYLTRIRINIMAYFGTD